MAACEQIVQGLGEGRELAGDPASCTRRTLSLTQTAGGPPSGGADALLSRTALDSLAADNAGSDEDLGARRLELKLGHGLPALGGRFTLTPEAGDGFSDTGRDYVLELRLAPVVDAGAFELSREAADAPGGFGAGSAPEHQVGLRLNARFRVGTVPGDGEHRAR